MDEKQIRQIAQEEIQKNANDNVFSVNPIPVHSHTGTDSPQVNPSDLINFSLYATVQQTTLSTSQILALHTTPISLVPPSGLGSSMTNINSFTVVEGISAKIYAGTIAYTGANNLEFRYTNGSGTKVTADIANTFINTTAGSQAYAHVAGVTTQFTPVVNSPIVVAVPTANPGAGNGKIVISVKYRVISF